MSLTGLPLLVLVAFAAVIVAAATAAGWRRFGRWRFLWRVLGILLTEATVLLAVGLAVNRSQQFYPSWPALIHRGSPIRDAPDRPGRLDQWLHARLGGHEDQPIAFAWRPSYWPTWHLAAPPTVVVPAGYLLHPSWRYPVVLVATSQHDWSDADQVSAAQWARSVVGPVVVVFAHVGPSVTAGILAAALPQSLIGDLRVTGHSWGIVASVAEGALAHQAVLMQPGRFPAFALVSPPSARRPPATVQQAVASARDVTAPQPPPPSGRSPLAGLPLGETVAVIAAPGSAAGPSTVDPVYLRATPTATLRTALRWACEQTPPPLAEAAPLIPPAPARSHTRHGMHVHPSTLPSAGPSEG